MRSVPLTMFALLGAPAVAQEAAAPADIVVTGRGLSDTPARPAYSSIEIDRETLTRAASGRIEDALAGVAGFQQFRRSDSRSSNPSAQGVTLRALGGNATSRALVLLDGVPMADPFFGYIPLSAIAPERLASARVTRGGGSGPFGAGALAGTIELTSADAAALGLFAGSALVNDRGESELSAAISPQLGQGFVTIAGRWDRGRGFSTTPEDQRVAASVPARFDSWSAGVRAVASVTPTIALQARMLAWRDVRTLRFAGANSLSEGQDASLRLIGRGNWEWEALAYVQARDFTNVVVSSTRFVPTLNQRATPSTGLGGKVELRPPIGGSHVLRIGADYRHSAGRLAEDALSTATGAVTERRAAGGVISDLGVFVENDWSIGALTLTAGLRADHFAIRDGFFRASAPDGRTVTDETYPARSGWAGSLRGGALLRVGGGWSIRGAGYTGLRLPTLNELYRPFVVFPITTRANPALNAERLAGFELGLDYAAPGRGAFSITAFDNRVSDAIANVTIAQNVRQRRNIDAIAARGIEANGRASFGAFSVEGSLALTSAVARGTGVAAALDRKRPAQTPAIAASATMIWQAAERLQLALTLRHVGAQFEDDLESDRLPAATTIDAYATVPLSRNLALVMRGENLTDTRVVTRNQGGSIDLGIPLTLWVGVRFDI